MLGSIVIAAGLLLRLARATPSSEEIGKKESKF